MVTGMILIDLQKAFDTIDHALLLRKLRAMNFTTETIKWFESYLSNRFFKVNIEKEFSSPARLDCGVPQGSILGPLLFLIYVNDMPRAINLCNLLLYADDSYLLFQSKCVKHIQQVLNNEFSNLCDWFVDNKLSIHFGEDKTKSILFCPKNKKNKIDPVQISYNGLNIKQYSKVSYLGCILDDCLSGESMALNVLNKINSRLSFLYRKQQFLTPYLKQLLCNALIQPHFDYACSSWYPNVNKNLQKKLQTAQNKCIRFCLQLDSRHHIDMNSFQKINWLPVQSRFEQIVNTHVFKSLNNKSPIYMVDIFKLCYASNLSTRSSYLKLVLPSVRTNSGKKSISFLGPLFWNKLDKDLKEKANVNSFKHALKKHLFDCKQSIEDNIYAFA